MHRKACLDGVVFHGLRKTAGAWLAEAGCTAHEIQAILGHRTLAMAQHYHPQRRPEASRYRGD